MGPVTLELLRRGLRAGRVPPEALICAVGSRRWMPPSEVLGALDLGAFDPTSERVHVDLQPLPAEARSDPTAADRDGLVNAP